MKNISETKATENCTQSFISGVMNVSEYIVYEELFSKTL